MRYVRRVTSSSLFRAETRAIRFRRTHKKQKRTRGLQTYEYDNGCTRAQKYDILKSLSLSLSLSRLQQQKQRDSYGTFRQEPRLGTHLTVNRKRFGARFGLRYTRGGIDFRSAHFRKVARLRLSLASQSSNRDRLLLQRWPDIYDARPPPSPSSPPPLSSSSWFSPSLAPPLPPDLFSLPLLIENA